MSLSLVCVLEARTMKQSFYSSALLLFLLLVFSTNLSARFIAPKEGQEEQKLNKITSGDSVVLMEGSESMDLMGVEVCDNGDEECFRRRVISEAHLDYIYTQHHKP